MSDLDRLYLRLRSSSQAQLTSESARFLMGPRTQLLQGSYTILEEFSQQLRQGIAQIKQMQLAIENDALDQILKLNLSNLPGLQAIVSANLMQHHCGINHSQMLLLFERACICFEQGETDLAMGMFIALLFLNPFIAPLWYCVARAFESKGNLEQSLYSYAVGDLLGRGDLPTALDAVECLIAKGNKQLAHRLLQEIDLDLRSAPFPEPIVERARKLHDALTALSA